MKLLSLFESFEVAKSTSMRTIISRIGRKQKNLRVNHPPKYEPSELELEVKKMFFAQRKCPEELSSLQKRMQSAGY
jgi:hypothetical protein